MEELTLLRQYIETENYGDALALIEELEEMSKEDKLNKIYSYGVILLLHLIKQAAENRTTRSWDFSIYNAAKAMQRTNKRRKAGVVYANREELTEILEDAFDTAIRKAALEAFEGKYSAIELEAQVNKNEILAAALDQIMN
ncbi:DUF29 domain-containing protein [Picosynechococcus sp. PCC 11901]|uniref:DUF29 family protein n=1 Tax=Picosynechococcus sp. PCC 11901 TaxID=2579791 RepID=UPI0010FC0EBC|nr:DUF29 family protein [Picosynechococcus sp. PCC 11901]QCS49053.1 DUF29 domain-containing protein [Picosynechococcus sp. PCC 11901]